MISNIDSNDCQNGKLHIPIGSVCNNNCIFCNEDRTTWDRSNAAYTPEVVKSLLEKYKNKRIGVNFTSGEPLLNSNMIQFVKWGRGFGYKNISITTNGRMLAYGKFALELVRAGVTEIIVSVHGHMAPIHNGLVRTKGAFEQTVKGLENVSTLVNRTDANLKLTCAVTLNKMNYQYFGDMVEFLQRYNPSEIVFNVVQPIRNNMAHHFKKVMPNYSDVAKVLEEYYLNNKSRFGINPSARTISVIDLPYCQSKTLLPYLGYGETRIVEDFCHKERALEDGNPTLERKVFVDNSGEKHKRNQCSQCVYNDFCNGIYKMYTDRFGWDEFEPVKTAVS